MQTVPPFEDNDVRDPQQNAPHPEQAITPETCMVPGESVVLNPPSHQTRYKEFEFPGVLASVPDYREQIIEFLTQQPIDGGDQMDLLIAIQEALANAALHGCKDDPNKKIFCAVTVDRSRAVIVVRDPGPGFNLELADPDKYVATKLRHGRGICLMRSLVTELSFARNGAEIVLRKQLSPVR
jgi:serine/threonine-protein kinase RsbW